MTKKKKELNQDAERISFSTMYSVDDNLCRHTRVDHVTCQGVRGHENQDRLLGRISPVPVHQMIRPSAPILPINNPTSTATSNVFGNNRSSSAGNLEQIPVDSPPTYADCMKNNNIDRLV